MSSPVLKLHLGCGEKYLEGYVNVDFPASEHSVMNPRVDLTADIGKLSYAENSVDEIRSHHLFEHFSRAEALKLLSRWRSWLKPNGVITVETPDFATCAYFFAQTTSLKRRFELARHMIGSQEAKWALHKDYWDKQKFLFVLKKFGFKDIKIRQNHNGLAGHGHELPGRMGKLMGKMLEGIRRPLLNLGGNMLPGSFYARFGSNKMPNIIVTARKDANIRVDADRAAREILALSLTGREGEPLLNVWLEEYQEF
jgi:predicted SAM-dependent methyltransferase